MDIIDAADTVSLSVSISVSFSNSVSQNLHFDQKLQMHSLDDDFVSNDNGIADNTTQIAFKKIPFHHICIFLFRKFAEIVLLCIKIPLIFVKDKKKIKRNRNTHMHTPAEKKKVIDLCQIKHISVNFISKSKTELLFFRTLNHRMVYVCKIHFFSHCGQNRENLHMKTTSVATASATEMKSDKHSTFP